jgi:hypothetical protein
MIYLRQFFKKKPDYIFKNRNKTTTPMATKGTIPKDFKIFHSIENKGNGSTHLWQQVQTNNNFF